MTIDENKACRWCHHFHGDGLCPHVKAFEFDTDGNVTRVEFLTPNDRPPISPELIDALKHSGG